MRKILFLINPVAGKKKATKIVPKIKKMCKDQKAKFSIFISTRALQITNLIKYELEKQKYTDVVAIGGDGTIVEVMNGILDTKIRLGIVPMGTGNDFARCLGIASPEEGLRQIFYGEPREISRGKVDGVFFINSAGVGIDGQILKDTERLKRYIPGSSAYFLSTAKAIFTYKSIAMRISLDEKIIKRQAVLLAIGNGPYIGGGMKIIPNANIEEDWFHICLVNNASRFRFLRLFPFVYKGIHGKYPEVEFFKARKIKIETPEKTAWVSADGNIISTTPAAIEMDKDKIWVWGPKRPPKMP